MPQNQSITDTMRDLAWERGMLDAYHGELNPPTDPLRVWYQDGYDFSLSMLASAEQDRLQ